MLCSSCYHVYARLTHYRPPCTLPCTTCCAPRPPASNAFRGNGACSASLQRLCPVTCGACRACDTPRLAMIISAAAARARALSSVPLSARTGVHCCPLRSMRCTRAAVSQPLRLVAGLLRNDGKEVGRGSCAGHLSSVESSETSPRTLSRLYEYTWYVETTTAPSCSSCCCCCCQPALPALLLLVLVIVLQSMS